jgi:hypothetical protein
MRSRENRGVKRAASREQVIAKAKRRFAEADVQIADLKEQGAQERPPAGEKPESEKD